MKAKTHSWFKKIVENTLNHHRTVLILLVVVTFAVFHQVLKNDFVNFDDNLLIFSNKIVVDRNTPTTECFKWGLYTPHYKPFVFLTWRFEFQTFGKNSAIFHLNNLLLHIANVILVFYLAKSLLRRFKIRKKDIIYGSFILSLLFSIHPLHVESVAWVVERKDVLNSFFFLSSWLLYIRYINKKNYTLIILSAGLYMCALLSKSMSITLIAVLILTDILYKRSDVKKLIIEKIPIFLCFIIATFLYGLHGFFLDSTTGLFDVGNTGISNINEGLNQHTSLVRKIIVSATKTFLWLLHIVFPIKISAAYEGTEIMRSLGRGIYLIPFILIGIFLWSYKLLKSHKEVLFGLMFFLITISPAFSITEVGGFGVFLSDRYTYIPQLGIMLILTIIILKSRHPMYNYILLFLLIAYSLTSFRTVKIWKNSEILWTNAINKSECNGGAYNGRGSYYKDQGEFDKALQDFQKAIACGDKVPQVYYNRVQIHLERGNLDEALKDINTYIKRLPKKWVGYQKRALIYEGLNRNKLALNDLNSAIELTQNQPLLFYNRSKIHFSNLNHTEALKDINQCIKLDPNFKDAISFRSEITTRLNNPDISTQTKQNQLKIVADNYDELKRQADELKKEERYQEAIEIYSKCINLRPDNFSNYVERGVLSLNLNANENAITDFTKALDLNPGYKDVLLFRSFAFNNLKKYSEAFKDAKDALASGVQVSNEYLDKITSSLEE